MTTLFAMSVQLVDLSEAQCSATSRSGAQCSLAAIPGGTVCRFHGGSAPQVRAKAAERLDLAIGLALDRLIERLYPPTLGSTGVDIETRDLVSLVDKFIAKHQLLTGQATSRDESHRVEAVRHQLELRLDSQAERVAQLVESMPESNVIDVVEVTT
jgi:hypothetical protein